MRSPCYTSLDDALETLAPYGIELKNGNSNHAPMVAEALCALGRPDSVMPWITRYRERMLPRPGAGDRIRRGFEPGNGRIRARQAFQMAGKFRPACKPMPARDEELRLG